jgi:glycosyltransferase involved in cell wall biosynthesis
MSKIFILGMSPLPFENDRKVYGTGIRTWQFILPLLERGHKICVCNYAIPSAYADGFRSKYIKDFIYSGDSKDKKDFINSTLAEKGEGEAGDGNPGSKEKSSKYSFEYNVLKKDDFENIELISEIFKGFKPDCIVGCTFYPSYIVSELLNYLKNKNKIITYNMKTGSSDKREESNHKDYSRDNGSIDFMKNINVVPFWADLFGHVMAEAQARAYIDGDDECLFHYWNSEYNIISSADIFSCVSSRQQYALIGELGAVGRLNKYTSGYDFTSIIPCGIPLAEYRHTKSVFRGGDIIKKDDFVVLWTGGYNTWTDIDTLFEGLTAAMEKNPKIKFVSTGGEIPEQDLVTYPRFLSMINGSSHRDRFVMKGWVPGEDVPNYYFEADLGINIDKDIYEVRLGSKNRILDWFRAGLCVLSSNVCELTDIMEKEKIGYTFKPYDYKDLSKKLIYLADNQDEVKKTAIAGKKYALLNFNFNKTTEKLQKWAGDPAFSPDRGEERKLFFSREEALENLNQITLRQKKMIEEREKRISELEGIIKKGFVYRIYSYFKIIKRKISG